MRIKALYIIPIIIIATLLIPSVSVQAQQKTFIKFNPFTLPQELDVYLSEELSPAITVEVGGGFIYTDYWDNILNQVKFGQLVPNIDEHQYLNALGYAVRLGLRFYIVAPKGNSKIAGTYFEPLLLFKEIWYPSKTKTFNNTSKVYHDRSIKYVSGLQLLIGRQHRWHSFYLDKYIGLGVKAKTYRFDNFKMTNTGDITNKGTRTTTWLPDIKLGIKIAFDLSKK